MGVAQILEPVDFGEVAEKEAAGNYGPGPKMSRTKSGAVVVGPGDGV